MLARLLAVLMIALGIGILIRTVAGGGGSLAYGFLFGALLTFAGALRLYLALRMRRG